MMDLELCTGTKLATKVMNSKVFQRSASLVVVLVRALLPHLQPNAARAVPLDQLSATYVVSVEPPYN